MRHFPILSSLVLALALFATTGLAAENKTQAIDSALAASTQARLNAGIQSPDISQYDARQEALLEKERQSSQPGNHASVWRTANAGVANHSSLPYPEAGVLIQKEGQEWRLLRNGTITLAGGTLLALVIFLISIFHVRIGPIKLESQATGKMLERFTLRERRVHTIMAGTFVVLAISGILLLYGKYLLLPVIGHTLFGWLMWLLKTLHNILGPLFSLAIIAGFLLFVRDNLPRKEDLGWLMRFGGLFTGKHVASFRFNAGEKIWFWVGLVVLGSVLSVTGLILDMLIPGLDYLRSTMQTANIVHAIAATLFIAMALGHIYIGTIGSEGSYQGMSEGYVDEAWAKQHHEYWYQEKISPRNDQASAGHSGAASHTAVQGA